MTAVSPWSLCAEFVLIVCLHLLACLPADSCLNRPGVSHPVAEASSSAAGSSLPATRGTGRLWPAPGRPDGGRRRRGPGNRTGRAPSGAPGLQALLCPRPPVPALARDYLAAHGIAGRCELTGGDFIASVPRRHRLHPVKSVLHDWDDGRCVTILRTCRAGMYHTAQLVTVKLALSQTMTADPALLPAALLDLIMLAYTGRREPPQPSSLTFSNRRRCASSEYPPPRRATNAHGRPSLS